MRLHLSSCDIGDDCKDLEEWLETHDNKIALIPNAVDAFPQIIRDDLIDNDVYELVQLGFSVSVVSLEKYFNNSENLEKDLDKFNSFYVIGGNIFVLRKAMELSGFDNYLKKRVNKDILYASYSAGSSILYNDLDFLSLIDKKINPYDYDSIPSEGLGIINYLPVVHYKNYTIGKKIDELVKYCNDNNINYKTLRDGDVIVDEVSKKVKTLK